MRRAGRRQINDYLEENEELNFEQTEELYEDEYEEYDESDAGAEDAFSEDEKSGAARVWKKIGKVALVILALIALFFVSMKVTEICLDRNQEPDSYGTDAPAYSDSDYEEEPSGVPVIEEESEENAEEETEVEEESKQPSYKEETSKPTTEKNEETQKPSTPSEPEKPVAPETPEKPSTPETPSTPSKPIITPGNPAA